MERFQQSLQALRELGNVVAVGRSGGSLDKIGDLAESFLDTPQMEQCIARWEDGWKLPVQEWRQRLGVIYPADRESYGLALD